MKRTKGQIAADRYNARRDEDIERMLEPLRAALRGSSLTYTAPVARAAAAFIADPVNASKAMAVVNAITEAHDQIKRSRRTLATTFVYVK